MFNSIKEALKSLIGFKIGFKRVIPISTKIIAIFIVIMIVSNITSNYINLVLNRMSIIRLAQQILVKELTDVYNMASTQHEIFTLNLESLEPIENNSETGNIDTNKTNIKKEELKKTTINTIEALSTKNTVSKTVITLGVNKEGTIEIKGSKGNYITDTFFDSNALNVMKQNNQGLVTFILNNVKYFGAYKYDDKWNMFIIRAEEIDIFYDESNKIFFVVSVIIFVFIIIFTFFGIIMLHHSLRYIRMYTKAFLEMNKSQIISPLNIENAPNDDITFLGATFNIFAQTIANLLEIFKKFASSDVVHKAYKYKEVKLEGKEMELTILFSDIKSFTFITETLGNDIIKLLNIHYEKAIAEISTRNGIIGSIIGDAILAIYGTEDNTEDGEVKSKNKSLQAIKSAYGIQKTALLLRRKMVNKNEKIANNRVALTEEGRNIFKSVLIEVGVGIDGGNVFYGNIGSYERMTNTVIGDNVNSASRLEGLTRVYKVPVICSEYIKEDVLKNTTPEENRYKFIELDLVQVKGKTIGKKVFWPVDINYYYKNKISFDNYEKGLYKYYAGDWQAAEKYLKQSNVLSSKVILQRIENNTVPEGWNGLWIMEEK